MRPNLGDDFLKRSQQNGISSMMRTQQVEWFLIYLRNNVDYL